ncbi:MAG TPA: cache domain-containing protein, partial [Armatimonadota bacterium]|nr:cache domain-containing protein [Armatimonadota bacterium]
MISIATIRASMGRSLAARILVPVLAATAVALAVLISVVSSRAVGLSERQAIETVTEMAHHYARRVELDLEEPLTLARTLARALDAGQRTGALSRASADTLLRSALEANPGVLGVWTAWEPNAFDGNDAAHAGTTGTDASGRFVPYWNRGSGSLVLEALVDYETPGTGDYYVVPRQRGREAVVNPYVYP